VKTVADQFALSTKKVRRLIKSGTLQGVQVGREWRIDHASVDRIVQQQAETGEHVPQ